MARVSLFGRQLLLSVGITSVFALALGFLSLQMVRQSRREAAPYLPPAVTFAKFLHEIPRNRRPEALAAIGVGAEGSPHFQFWLLTKDGMVLYPKNALAPPLPLGKIRFPVKMGAYAEPEGSQTNPHEFTVVQVDDDQSEYLLVRSIGHGGPKRLFWTNLASLLVAVILGTTLSLMILFYSLRNKARLADSVISELQRGNLKARFPVTKMDEVGEAMLRFNKMADEIERLVERLKSTEKSRMSMLQELAHDLRTPVASLKNMIETLSVKDGSMPAGVKAELLTLSLKEVDYFEHLVEDLLFLARATEPSYVQSAQTVDLSELIEAEIESVTGSGQGSGQAKKIVIEREIFTGPVSVRGDAHLLRRLFRNALDNASSFASSRVKVKFRKIDGAHVECAIEDDGPGFTADSLKEFGHRKMSRQFTSTSQRRASIGLGSVIMNAVVSLHRGRLEASNVHDSSGKILGAQVKITLPL